MMMMPDPERLPGGHHAVIEDGSSAAIGERGQEATSPIELDVCSQDRVVTYSRTLSHTHTYIYTPTHPLACVILFSLSKDSFKEELVHHLIALP